MVHLCFCRLRKVLIAYIHIYVYVCVCVCVWGRHTMRNYKIPLLFFPQTINWQSAFNAQFCGKIPECFLLKLYLTNKGVP